MIAVFAGLAVTLISMAFLRGGIAVSFEMMLRCLSDFNRDYVLLARGHGLQHGMSLFGLIKAAISAYFIIFLDYSKAGPVLKSFYAIYPFMVIIIFALACALLIRKEVSYWQKVYILVAMLLLLPQVSYDYKLIHLFFPLLFFLKSSQSSKYDYLYAMIFGLLMIPKDYFWLVSDVSIAVIINPLLLGAMLGAIALEKGGVAEE